MNEEKIEEAEEIKPDKTNKTFLKNMNYWVISTVVLVLILVIVLISGSITGNAISSNTAGQKLLDFANAQGMQNVELVKVNDYGSTYEVILSIDGNEIPVYVTKDGKYIASQLIPLEIQNTNTQSSEIPKSDKPQAELFIWSYCPYGVTALTPFAQVAELLSGSADFQVRLYYSGHGDFEVQQNKIQACIQKYEKNKYWDYAKKFVQETYEKCYGNISCDLKESKAIMSSLGINSNKILSCVEDEGETLTTADYERAGELGVTGSPTLVVNGIKASVARDAESYKGAVCSAFNNIPDECSITIESSGNTTPSGSCG